MTDFKDIYATDFDRIGAINEAMTRYVKHNSTGKVPALVISGPAGVGKTSLVTRTLASTDANYRVVTGKMTPLALYAALYEHRELGSVLVLDDVDSVYRDHDAQNLLKAALDTTPTRTISWESSRSCGGLSSSFTTNGSVILITNTGLASKAKTHLNAIASRSHNISIGDDTNSEIFKHICYMVHCKGMLADTGLTTAQINSILCFINTNLNRFANLSLRTAVKISQLMLVDPENWQIDAQVGVFN